MSSSRPKKAPLYAIASIDHALRLASILQLEGSLSVAAAARRLGVARSTAHRMLQMLVYRDFALQDDLRIYRPGPLLGPAPHLPGRVAELRESSLPVLRRLSATIDDTAEVSIRVGDTVRLVAAANPTTEGISAEGMAFALHDTTTGLLSLASESKDQLTQYVARHTDMRREKVGLRLAVERVRRSGFALTSSRAAPTSVAIGVPIAGLDGGPFAALSISLPTASDDGRLARQAVALLRSASAEVSSEWTGRRHREMAG